ncbi:hypothetical protein L1987_74254 [Smallanthus sonchifolius]|uniref:Uncharacterized protein n=1 Tax=Smallanthus sonchifolius TaxID=185202 RepID=A0ACB9A2K1_9ASTR|nr:hypothetical protein L1987_74254 [Smallanthus sonchifolius]
MDGRNGNGSVAQSLRFGFDKREVEVTILARNFGYNIRLLKIYDGDLWVAKASGLVGKLKLFVTPCLASSPIPGAHLQLCAEKARALLNQLAGKYIFFFKTEDKSIW